MWSYPTISAGLRDLLMRKCTLEQDGDRKEGEEGERTGEGGQGLAFSFGHYSEIWYYLTNFTVTAAPTGTLAKVSSLELVDVCTGKGCYIYK